ncbi:MAG: bifunctional DNA primase/polymerase [Candidatus Moranbacteria bacterium]|nr:bifunctional DNA primase/polymerase [Candidatus Moranbacteria bacterium]
MNAYELALTYNALGWNVIPIGKNSKVPTCDFKEYIDRQQSQTDIFELFSEHIGNIALLTGKVSGIVAVDMDTYKENYSGINIFSPLSVKSPRGGKHLYFRYEEGQGNEAELKGIGIRSTGYYVVLPPSTVDGKSYEWESVPSTDLIKNLPPLPKNLLDAFAVKPGQSKSKNLIEFVGLKEGESREVNMHAVACKLYNQYSWEETVAICQGINKTYVPPLDDEEFKHALKGVKEHIDANPREDFLKKKEQEVVKQKVSELKEEKAPRRNFKNEKRFSWGTDILNHSFAIIKETDFIVFGAKRSSGKTTFAFDMALKNARDFGHKVLFVSLEMEQKDILDDLARKTSAVHVPEEFDMQVPEYKENAYNRRLDEIESISTLMFRGIRRASDVTWEMIEALILAQPVDLVFIDNLDLIAGNRGESDYDRQKRITSSIMGFTSKNKVPIILIHHYRKSGKEDRGMDELAGSGKIADHADRIIKVMKNSDPEAPYPDKYRSEVYLQKGRGYPECKKSIFFIKGTFVDTPPIVENEPRIQHALDLMGGTIIDN